MTTPSLPENPALFHNSAASALHESLRLCALATGKIEDIAWESPAPRKFSFFDMKGRVEFILRRLRVRGQLQSEPFSSNSVEAGKRAFPLSRFFLDKAGKF